MKRVAGSLLLSLVAASVAVAPVAAQGPAPDAAPPPLAEAVTFASLGTSTILYTDWAATKAAHSLEDFTRDAPVRDRAQALVDLMKVEAPFAAFGWQRFMQHAETWGWDTSDLDWEASLVTDGPPVAVLRFRDGFDLAPITAHFDDRGFTTEVHGDATIRSHAMDLGADWMLGEFGILNTAFVDDGRTLVLSSSLEAVKAVLDARHIDFAQAPPSWVVAGALGSPLSAAIEVGTDACAVYDPRIQGGGDPGANADLLAEVGPLHAWQAMGVGTYRDDAGAAARYVFDHGTDSEALADLAGRARLADQGISLLTDQPYAASLFRLVTFTTDGRDILLDVAPVEDASRRLQEAFFGRDMVFATCG